MICGGQFPMKLMETYCHRVVARSKEWNRVSLNKLQVGTAACESKQAGLRLCRELTGASRVSTEKFQLKFLLLAIKTLQS